MDESIMNDKVSDTESGHTEAERNHVFEARSGLETVYDEKNRQSSMKHGKDVIEFEKAVARPVVGFMSPPEAPVPNSAVYKHGPELH